MIGSLWELISGVCTAVWGLVITILTFTGDSLLWLHLEMPRLEGLLVGILLAWLLVRRDKHPLLRAASAPLKLVLDILDLAWDQVVETVRDIYDTSKDWTLRGLNWAKQKTLSAYKSVLSFLSGIKDKLTKK